MSMNEIRAMREKRVKLWEAAKAFVESRKDANGTLSAEDSATYDQMEADVIRMGKEIERLERQEALDLEFDRPTARPHSLQNETLGQLCQQFLDEPGSCRRCQHLHWRAAGESVFGLREPALRLITRTKKDLGHHDRMHDAKESVALICRQSIIW